MPSYKGYSTPQPGKPPKLKVTKRIRLPKIIARPLQFQARTLIRHDLVQKDPWWLIVHRRGVPRPKVGIDPLEARAAPHSEVRGTLPERIFYKYLVDSFHLIPGVDFIFQSSLQGGRMYLGGLVADFVFPAYTLVVQVQGPTHRDFIRMRKDDEQALSLGELGYRVLALWENTIYDERALDDWGRRNIIYGNSSTLSSHDPEYVWLGDGTLIDSLMLDGQRINQYIYGYS